MHRLFAWIKGFVFISVSPFLFPLSAMPPREVPPFPRPLLRDRNVWANGGETWCYLPADPRNSSVLVQNGVYRVLVPPQSTSSSYAISREAIWTVAYSLDTSGNERLRLVGQKLDSPTGRWDIDAGQIETQYGIPLFLFPTEDPKLFLGFNYLSGFAKNGKASYAAHFVLSNNKIIFDDCIDLPFKELKSIAKFSSHPGDAKNQGHCEPIDVFLQPNLLNIVQNDRYVFVTNTKLGIIWVLSTKNGEFIKTIQLSQVVLKDVFKTAFIDHYVLGMEPLKDGDVLIAVRQPETIENAIIMYSDLDQHSSLYEKYKNEYLTLMNDFRDICWIRIDGKTLSWQKDETMAPAWRFNYNATRNFHFLVGPSGDILLNTQASWATIMANMHLVHPNSK